MSEQNEIVTPEPLPAPMVPEPEPMLAPAPRRRRSGLIIALSLGGVVLLVAAFLGGRLLNGQPGLQPGLGSIIGPGGQGQAVQAFQINMGEPPEELPRTPPDVNGQFAKRSDNILSLGTQMAEGGTGVVSITAGGAESAASPGSLPSIPTPSGPLTEVVVTKETKIYRDSTFDDLNGGMPADTNQTIQQKVAEATLDEIGSGSFVTVWGRKNGDRVIADVVFFTSPVVFSRGN